MANEMEHRDAQLRSHIGWVSHNKAEVARRVDSRLEPVQLLRIKLFERLRRYDAIEIMVHPFKLDVG